MPLTDDFFSHSAIDNTGVAIGIGLRHPHFEEALSGAPSIDFVEVHAENFFAEGGLALSVLEQMSERYPISLHATSMGPGSASGIAPDYLERLHRLVSHINPWLVSDHACFSP